MMSSTMFFSSEGPSHTSPSTEHPSESPTQDTYALDYQRSSISPREPGTHAPAPGLNPRSCVTCRKRKVKCDKKQPCSNCTRGGVECIFPKPGRAPRRSRKQPDSELLARLRRLEGVVQQMGKTVDGENDSNSATSGKSPKTDPDIPVEADTAAPGAHIKWQPDGYKGIQCPFPVADGVDTHISRLEQDMGRLVLKEDGRTRYVNNSFWAGLKAELSEMQNILVETSDDEDDDLEVSAAHDPTPRPIHQEFVLGYSSTMLTLRPLHPQPKYIMKYWKLWVENVSPVMKIMHRPSMERLFMNAVADLNQISRPAEAIMFTLYLSVITSLSVEDCKLELGLDREVALRQFRYASEQALARAGFIETQDFLVLQAFLMLLVCIRRQDDTRLGWTLVGLAIRMANALGLHRDGSHFGLNPFDTELRRRCWWQILAMDARSSEDQGGDLMAVHQFFDTKCPRNLNDEDIWPGMDHEPVEHKGCTEMTLELLRYEIGAGFGALNANPFTGRIAHKGEPVLSLEAKDALIEKLRLRLEDKILRYCDMSNNIQWIAANVARLVLAKMWLMVHHPFKLPDKGQSLSQEVRDRTFLTSVDIIRYSRVLELQNKALKFGWMFRTYFQWHAVSYLLTELCRRLSGPEVDEAWRVIDDAFVAWTDISAGYSKSVLWRPLLRMLAKARALRAKELARLREFPTDGTIGRKPSIPSACGGLGQTGFTAKIPVMSIASTLVPVLGDFSQAPEMTSMSPIPDFQTVPDVGTQGFGGDIMDMGQWLGNDEIMDMSWVTNQNMNFENWELNNTFQVQGQQAPGGQDAVWGWSTQ